MIAKAPEKVKKCREGGLLFHRYKRMALVAYKTALGERFTLLLIVFGKFWPLVTGNYGDKFAHGNIAKINALLNAF